MKINDVQLALQGTGYASYADHALRALLRYSDLKLPTPIPHFNDHQPRAIEQDISRERSCW
jgi:hypothetical protein